MKQNKITNFLNNYKPSTLKAFIDSDDEIENMNKQKNEAETDVFSLNEKFSNNDLISSNEVNSSKILKSPLSSELAKPMPTDKPKAPVLKKLNKTNKKISATNFFDDINEEVKPILNNTVKKEEKQIHDNTIYEKTNGNENIDPAKSLKQNDSEKQEKAKKENISDIINHFGEINIEDLKNNYSTNYINLTDKPKVFEDLDLKLDGEEETIDSTIIEHEILKKELYNLPDDGKKQLILNISEFLSKPKIKLIFTNKSQNNLNELTFDISSLTLKDNLINRKSHLIVNKIEVLLNEIYIPNSFSDENITANLMNVSKTLKDFNNIQPDSSLILSSIDSFFNNIINNRNDLEQLKINLKNNFNYSKSTTGEVTKQTYSFEYETNILNKLTQSNIQSVVVNSLNSFSIENILFTALFGTKHDISILTENYYKQNLNENNKDYFIISMLKAKPFKEFTAINFSYINNNFLDILRIMIKNFESKSLKEFLTNIYFHYENYEFIPLLMSLLLTKSIIELNEKQIEYFINLSIDYISISTYEKLYYAEIASYLIYKHIITNPDYEHLLDKLGFLSILIKFKFVLLKKPSDINDNLKTLSQKIFENRKQFGAISNNEKFDLLLREKLVDSKNKKIIKQEQNTISKEILLREEIILSNKISYDQNDKGEKINDFKQNKNETHTDDYNQETVNIKQELTLNEEKKPTDEFIKPKFTPKPIQKVKPIIRPNILNQLSETEVKQTSNNILSTNCIDFKNIDDSLTKESIIDEDKINKDNFIKSNNNKEEENTNNNFSTDNISNTANDTNKSVLHESAQTFNTNSTITDKPITSSSFFINAFGFLVNKSKIKSTNKEEKLNESKLPSKPIEHPKEDFKYDPILKRYLIRGKVIEDDDEIKTQENKIITLPPKAKGINLPTAKNDVISQLNIKDSVLNKNEEGNNEFTKNQEKILENIDPNKLNSYEENEGKQENFSQQQTVLNPFSKPTKPFIKSQTVNTKKPQQKYASFFN